MLKFSKYQEAVINQYNFTKKNLVIAAGPGCGKSFILVHLLKITPVHLKAIFLAFNKSISEELRKKVPLSVKVSTLHALGIGFLYFYFKNKGSSIKVIESKSFVLGKKYLDLSMIKKQNLYLYQVSSILDIYRIYRCSSLEEAYNLSSVVVENLDQFLQHCKELQLRIDEYNQKAPKEFMIDFLDMLYLPIRLNLNFPVYDVVFIDEVQDLSLLQKQFIDKLITSKSRIVVVGDERQVIYSFQGASLEVLRSFRNMSNTIELPLSLTYRCSKKVVEEANKIFPGLEGLEDSKEGEVRWGKLEESETGDFILCRNNLPLVEAFLCLLVLGKPAFIYGRDLHQDLLKILEKVESSDIEDSFDELQQFLDKVEEDLTKRGINNPKCHPKYVDLQEKILILRLLITQVGSISETFALLDKMFNKTEQLSLEDSKRGIVLMTIHKSKGLEAKRVFFKAPNLIPSKYSTSKEDLYSEKCLMYVAITRAKESLIYIS